MKVTENKNVGQVTFSTKYAPAVWKVTFAGSEKVTFKSAEQSYQKLRIVRTRNTKTLSERSGKPGKTKKVTLQNGPRQGPENRQKVTFNSADTIAKSDEKTVTDRHNI